ncbi:MAG: glycosyl hydrolase family 18 protein [Halanaerobiales bacterium]
MKKISGYYVNNNTSSQNSLKNNYNKIESIFPTGLEIKSDGTVINNLDENSIQFLKKYKNREKIIPLIQNHKLKSQVSNEIVLNKKSWRRTFHELICFLKKYNFSNLNFNLEGIKKENQETFNLFIEYFAGIFHLAGYDLGFSVPAKTEDNNSEWAGAYDYTKLDQEVDELIIMAYDYHWSRGNPGPIAPFSWVRDIIDYTLVTISRARVFLGIPCYGYDWIVGKDERARGLSHSQVRKIIKTNGGNWEWDQESKTPYYKYEDEQGRHEIWFENKTSINKKLELVQQYQLAGAVFWRLGLEDPAIWNNF